LEEYAKNLFECKEFHNSRSDTYVNQLTASWPGIHHDISLPPEKALSNGVRMNYIPLAPSASTHRAGKIMNAIRVSFIDSEEVLEGYSLICSGN